MAKLTARISIPCTVAEKELVRRAATELGMTMSDFVRDAMSRTMGR